MNEASEQRIACPQLNKCLRGKRGVFESYLEELVCRVLLGVGVRVRGLWRRDEETEKQGKRESEGVCCEWERSNEWLAHRNSSAAPQQNRVRERGNVGGALYRNSTFHHSHHTSAAAQTAQEISQQMMQGCSLFTICGLIRVFVWMHVTMWEEWGL